MFDPIQQNSSVVILMTACIIPDGMEHTALQDPEIRKTQYLESIEYYLNETNYHIVFCENTGTNIFKEIKSAERYERLEYLTFLGNDYDKSIGKGYGEALIIRHAIRHSQWLKKADYIIKITGRVKVLNLDELTKFASKNDRKKLFIALELPYTDWANSVCFLAPKTWLSDTIEKYGTYLHDHIGWSFETMLYRSITETRQMKIYPYYPIIDGMSGFKGAPYVNLSLDQRNLRHYYTLHCLLKNRGGGWNRMISSIVWLKYIAWVKIYFYSKGI